MQATGGRDELHVEAMRLQYVRADPTLAADCRIVAALSRLYGARSPDARSYFAFTEVLGRTLRLPPLGIPFRPPGA